MDKPETLGLAVGRYLDIRKAKVSANTWRNDRVAMNALISALGTRLPLAELSRELFETKFFGSSGAAHATSASTFNAYLSRMRRFTQTATSYGWMGGDPLLGVSGRRRTPTPPRQILDAGTLLRLVEATRSPRDRIAVAIATNTALRANEIADLRVSDARLAAGRLNARIHKTGVYDEMPITAELDAELRRWFDHYRRWTPDGELKDDWFLVPQHNYAPRWTAEDRTMDYKLFPHRPVAQPYDIVKRALEALALPTDQEGFHTIRRSVGRVYYQMMKARFGHESALVATAALLHHKDIRQTQHYIGVQPERMERDEILRGKPFLTSMSREICPDSGLPAESECSDGPCDSCRRAAPKAGRRLRVVGDRR